MGTKKSPAMETFVKNISYVIAVLAIKGDLLAKEIGLKDPNDLNRFKNGEAVPSLYICNKLIGLAKAKCKGASKKAIKGQTRRKLNNKLEHTNSNLRAAMEDKHLEIVHSEEENKESAEKAADNRYVIKTFRKACYFPLQDMVELLESQNISIDNELLRRYEEGLDIIPDEVVLAFKQVGAKVFLSDESAERLATQATELMQIDIKAEDPSDSALSNHIEGQAGDNLEKDSDAQNENPAETDNTPETHLLNSKQSEIEKDPDDPTLFILPEGDTFGAILEIARNRLGLSQKAVAEVVGISPQVYSNLATNKRKKLAPKELGKLAEILQVSKQKLTEAWEDYKKAQEEDSGKKNVKERGSQPVTRSEQLHVIDKEDNNMATNKDEPISVSESVYEANSIMSQAADLDLGSAFEMLSGYTEDFSVVKANIQLFREQISNGLSSQAAHFIAAAIIMDTARATLFNVPFNNDAQRLYAKLSLQRLAIDIMEVILKVNAGKVKYVESAFFDMVEAIGVSVEEYVTELHVDKQQVKQWLDNFLTIAQYTKKLIPSDKKDELDNIFDNILG